MNDPLDGLREAAPQEMAKLHRAIRVGHEARQLLHESELGKALLEKAENVMATAENGLVNASPHDYTGITEHQINFKAANMAITWLIESINDGAAAELHLTDQINQEVTPDVV